MSPSIFSRWKFCVHADKRQMLQDLTQSLQVQPAKDHVLWELANCISSAVGADGFHLYLPDLNHSETLLEYMGLDSQNGHKVKKVREGSVPYYVAKWKQPIKSSKGDQDSRFPAGIGRDVSPYFFGHLL